MPRLSIRLQLLALVAAVAVPLVAILAYTIYGNSRQAVAEAKANAHVLAVVAASDVTRILAANRDVLKQIAKRPIIRAVDSKHCDPVLWDFMGMFPKSANMTVIDTDGIAICSAVPQPGGKPVNVSKAEWFKRSLAGDDFVVGKPFFGPITGRWVTVLTYPIHDDSGKKAGFLGLPLDLALYEPNLSGAPLIPGTTVGIMTSEMKMVWRNIEPEKWVGKDIGYLENAKQLLAMKSGEREGVGLDGTNRFYSITPVEGVDWFAFVGIPSDSVYSHVRDILIRNALMGVFSLLGFIGFALFIARRIERPVQALADTARAVKNGDGNIRARIEGAPEMVEVAAEFNQMLDVRLLVEAELHLMNERFVMASRAGQIGVWDWNIPKNELLWDGSMYRLYGLPEGTFGGAYEAWARAIHPQDKAYTEGEIQAALRGEREYAPEFRIVRPDGAIRYLKADSQTFRDEDGQPLRMIGTNIDITERKRMEKALEVSEQEFRSLAESSPDFIIRYDIKHCMRYLNRALSHFLGLASADEVIGKQPIEVWPDGRFAIIDGVAARVIKTGNAETVESMMPAETGEYRFHQIRVVAERDVAGQIVGTIALGRDITERRRMEDEIRKLNQDLEQRVAERTAQLEVANKELEAFSYSVSHDLRTPLRAIDGFSNILLEDYGGKLGGEGKRMLNVVRDNTRRMGQLINDILQFSRTGRLELNTSEVDMGALARVVVGELKEVYGSGKLQIEIEPLPSAKGDRAMLHQVFENLLSNAIKFSRHQEAPRISVGGRAEEGEAVYFVKDNGVGFNMEFVGKLFGVFERLHSMEEFEGTGIGLAIVKRIVTRHGGRVWAEGKVNEGATVYFALPTIEGSHG